MYAYRKQLDVCMHIGNNSKQKYGSWKNTMLYYAV